MIPDENFPKREHLLKTGDFRRVYSKGLSVRANSIVLYCLPNALGNNRIGFSISSRNIKLANRRNRIRRHFKEIFRRNRRSLKKGFDIVLIVKRDLDRTVSHEKLKDLFLKLAKEASIF